jgi:tryptophan 2,3-dioxygenase
VVQRIQRINSIWKVNHLTKLLAKNKIFINFNFKLKLLTDQINILETMAPTDFLDFRVYLSTASGFQSVQFRIFENKLGLTENYRIKYNQQRYDHVFKDEGLKSVLKESEEGASLLKLVEAWLERTPCLVSVNMDKDGTKNEINFFLREFKKGFERYLKDTYLDPIEVVFLFIFLFLLFLFSSF